MTVVVLEELTGFEDPFVEHDYLVGREIQQALLNQRKCAHRRHCIGFSIVPRLQAGHSRAPLQAPAF
jgi:hypothetical protein